MPTASPLSKLLTRVEQFVTSQNGRWTHAEWEGLVEDARKFGFPFDEDECKRNLGNILEASKYFYNRASAAPAPAKKKAAARKKTDS
jgi:hypothetical protein